VGPCHGIEGGAVVEVADLGLVERALQRAAGHRRGEVEKGAGDAGDSDAVVLGDLAGLQRRRSVDPEPGPLRPAAGAADGDIDARRAGGPDLPQRRGRRVAQHRARPGGQHGGHAPPVDRQHAMPDGVDAAVNPMQPPRLRAPRHSTARQAQRGELSRADHPVLPVRQARNLRVERTLDEFVARG
jgi:hypothetical protein